MLNIIILAVLIIALIVTIGYGIIRIGINYIYIKYRKIVNSYGYEFTDDEIDVYEKELVHILSYMTKEEFIQWFHGSKYRRLLLKISYHHMLFNNTTPLCKYLQNIYKCSFIRLITTLEIFDLDLYNEQIPDDKLFELMQIAYGEGKIGE